MKNKNLSIWRIGLECKNKNKNDHVDILMYWYLSLSIEKIIED